MQSHRTAVTADSGGDEKLANKSLQLSSLFTTMQESNALLRDEITHMEGKQKDIASVHRLTNMLSPSRKQTTNGSRQLHSQSLPSLLPESSASSHAPPASSQEPPEQAQPTPPPSVLQSLATGNKGAGSSIHTSDSLESESESADTEEGDEADERSEGEAQKEPSLPFTAEQSQAAGKHRLNDLCPLPVPPLSITSISSTELSEAVSECSSESNSFASLGESTIETMWDNFSIEEYAPPIKHNEKRVKSHVSEPVRQTWSPQITIPEPFTMTIREEAKPKKKKSRALITAEQEKLDREMQEALECQKQFRALPVPATTYIPLDELRREEENERKAQVGQDKIVKPIKPFSFMKREEEKRLQKLKAIMNSDKQRQRVFRAKPVPHSILNPQIGEQLKEKEEYRRILIQVRSQDILARAKLPKSMQTRNRRCHTSGKQPREGLKHSRDGYLVTKEHTFRPKIKSSIPDHDQLYFQFQQQLAARREVKPPTSPKPFVLQTSSTPSRRAHLREEQSEHTASSAHSLSSTRPSNIRTYSAPCSQPTYSFQMTETAKLRQRICEKKLAEDAEKEEEEEEDKRHKRKQQRELQSRVIQQVQSYDHSAWLQDKQRHRLHELRSVIRVHLSFTLIVCVPASYMTYDVYMYMPGSSLACSCPSEAANISLINISFSV